MAGFAAIALLAVPQTAAQQIDADIEIEPNIPVLILADEVDYDRETEVVTASGNVEISQGERILRADTVRYNQRTGVVVAEGNVSLTEPDGNVVFADRVELTEDLKEGVVEQFGLLFPDRTRVAANRAQRTGGNRTVMGPAVFSPCYLCEEDPTRPPLWQLRAREVEHDGESRDIIYRDARMEIFGVPVLYTPYFSHPDPTVRRRSGFLVPTFGTDSQLGTFATIPYYWVIGPDSDATLTPFVTTQERAAMFMEYRRRLQNGQFIAQGSYTYVTRRDDDGNRLNGNVSRGHMFTRGRFDIDRHWRWGFDGEWTTDDTYLRRYEVTSTDVLITTPFVEGFYGRDYYHVRGYHFQGLRVTDDYRSTPIIYPFAEMEMFGRPMGDLGRWHFQANLLNLGRFEGADSRRLSVTAGWRLPLTHPLGFRLTVHGNVNGDFYWVQNVARTGKTSFDGTVARVYPQLRADWRYPFVRELGNVRHVIEPRVALVAAPSGLNTSLIPNEDSGDLEFDDSNLFALNRFPGRDRVDDGVRLVYGLRTQFLGNSGGRTELFLGQSFRLTGNANFPVASGLDNDISDLVGRVRIAPSRYFDLLYRFRIKPAELEFRRNELQASFGAPVLRLSLNYVFFNEGSAFGEFDDREEFNGTVTSQITRNWQVFASGRWDLSDDGGILDFSVGGRFQNECCTVRLSFNRSFTRDRDLQASTSFLIQVVFKHLGSFGTS